MQTQMKKSLSKVWKIGLTLLFGIVVWLFWWLRYPFALSYQEQFQLFLLDDDYFMSRMAEPGGLARYVAEFLVQFYNVVVVGAAIIAVLLVLMQLITWRLMRSKVHNPLSIFYYPLASASLVAAPRTAAPAAAPLTTPHNRTAR